MRERERIRRHLLMKSKWSALIGSSINSHQCRIPVECEAHWVGSYLPSCRGFTSVVIYPLHCWAELGGWDEAALSLSVWVWKRRARAAISVWHVGKLNCRIEGSFLKTRVYKNKDVSRACVRVRAGLNLKPTPKFVRNKRDEWKCAHYKWQQTVGASVPFFSFQSNPLKGWEDVILISPFFFFFTLYSQWFMMRIVGTASNTGSDAASVLPCKHALFYA